MTHHWYPILEKISTTRVLLLTFLVTGIGSTIIALAEGTFIGRDPDFRYWIGPFFVWPVAYLVLLPVIVALIHLTYANFASAIDKGISDGIIVLDNGKRALPYTDIARSKWKLGLLAIFSVALTCYMRYSWITQFSGRKTWELGSLFGLSVLFYFAAAIVAVALFIAINAAIDFLLWTLMIYRISRNGGGVSLRPTPFHPDGSAGLQKFGQAALSFYFVLVAVSVFITAQVAEKFHVYPDDCPMDSVPSLVRSIWPCLEKVSHVFPGVIWALTAVALILPIAFLAPLVPLRSRILQCKKAIMEAAWEDSLAGVNSARIASSFAQAQPHYLQLIDRVKVYEYVARVSDWPFGRQTAVVVIVTTSPALLSAGRHVWSLAMQFM
jgi:hypothetical protein